MLPGHPDHCPVRLYRTQPAANVDFRAGIFLGIGGMLGAQFGARILEHTTTANFKKIFSLILIGLAGYLFFKK